MEPLDRAIARSRAYTLLASLTARGVTDATREAAIASPILAPTLAGEHAVDHQYVLGFAVPPFEGAFLDPEGHVGASAAESLRDSYRAMGFRPDPTAEDPEHLATELRALAFLSAAEADALADGLPEIAARTQTLAAAFLDDHLRRWLPALAGAVRRIGRAFPTALVEQIEALVRVHRGEIADPRAPFALPDPTDPTRDEQSGLRELAAFLSCPARSGIFLSRDDLARIGRTGRVPRGFGERAVLLENMLRSAAHLDAWHTILSALDDCLEAAQRDLPEEDETTAPWRARLEETRALLRRLDATARETAESTDARA